MAKNGSTNAAGLFFFNFMFAWLVSAFSGTVAYPWDTVRRLQMQEAESANPANFLQCFRGLYREGGIIRFFRG